MEECLTLEELRLILDASRERELRHQKFLAAIQGIDLGKAEAEDAEKRFREVQERVQAKRAGKSKKEFELNQLGFDVEKE